MTHKFASIATFDVTLTVKDNDGAEQAVSKSVEVLSNSPPVAVINAPATGAVKNKIHFDGSASFDPDGRVTDHLWDFGDGSKSHQEVADHEFTKEKDFTVTLRVTDNKGQTGTKSKDIKIEKPREIQCTGPGKQNGPDVLIDILSYNKPFAIFKTDGGNASCAKVFYKCGDLKKGGLHGRGSEEWWGSVCAVWDRLDGTFRVQLVRGNATPHPETKDVYLHAQSCGGGYCK